jgi:hypothetical protein
MDQIYRPISDSDNESETHATTELPIESWDKFKDDYKKAADISDHELTPEEAAESIRSRRDEVPTAENASARPVVKLTSKGDGPKTLNQAADDLAFSRGLQQRDELLASGFTEEEVQQHGLEKIAAAQRGDPREMPVEVKIEDPPGEENSPLTPEQAAERLSKWRADQAAARQQELAEFTEQRLQEYEAAQAQQAQPEPQQQPAQPKPTERDELAQERQRLTQLRQMDGFEAAARTDYDQLVQAVAQEFPSLRNGPPNPADVEALRVQDPARFQRLAQADQLLRQSQQRIAAMAQQRGLREQQEAQITAQQRAQAAAQHDAQFEARAAKLVPNWEQQRTAVQAAAKKALVDAGISEAEQHRLWHQGTPIDIRSSAAQELILKAALWDSAQQKAHLIRQSNLPKVIMPGTGNANRGNGAESRVADLRARMKTAKGNESLRLATELTKAKRALNN